MQLPNISLPNITDSDLESKKERRAIKEYLYTLTEQLRYTLNNIDTDNLSGTLLDTIEESSSKYANLNRKLEDAEGNYSVIKQTAALILASVGNAAGDIAAIQITANSIQQTVTDAKGNTAALILTAEAIAADVSDAKGNTTSILQTASSISAKLGDATGNKSGLMLTADTISTYVSSAAGNTSTIIQKADGIRTDISSISGTLGTVSSSIELLSTRISMVVSAENVIKGAEIILGINAAADAGGNSFVKIAANAVNIDGVATFMNNAGFVKGADIYTSGTTTIDGGKITTGSISADLIEAGTFVGFQYKTSEGSDGVWIDSNGINFLTMGNYNNVEQSSFYSRIKYSSYGNETAWTISNAVKLKLGVPSTGGNEAIRIILNAYNIELYLPALSSSTLTAGMKQLYVDTNNNNRVYYAS